MYKKCNPVKDTELYEKYIGERPCCMCCARTDYLSRHHIIKFGRSDERCNLFVACLMLCHPLAEGIRVTHNGVKYEPLLLGEVLAIKKLRTPDEYDEKRLESLYGQALPDLMPIPEWVQDMYSGARKR